MARQFKKPEGQIKYDPSTQGRLELSRNYHTQYLMLKLTVDHTNENGASFNDAKLFSLINNISIIANGNENIKQIPGHKLYIDNVIYTGNKGMCKIDETAGEKQSYVYANIFFSIPGVLRPHDTILNTAVFTNLDLVVDWGSNATIGTGINVTKATLEVDSCSLVNYRRNAGETIKYYKEVALFEDITSSSSERTITMNVGKAYKSITIAAMVNGKVTDDMINRVILKSGTTVFLDQRWDRLRADNNFNIHPDDPELLKGIGILNFSERGRLGDMLDTIKNFNTLELVLDVKKLDGDNKVFVYSDTVANTNVVEFKG